MGKSGECFCVVKMSHLYAGARFYELLWLSSLRSDLIPTILYSVHAKKGGKSCVPTLSHILQKDKNIHKLHDDCYLKPHMLQNSHGTSAWYITILFFPHSSSYYFPTCCHHPRNKKPIPLSSVSLPPFILLRKSEFALH